MLLSCANNDIPSQPDTLILGDAFGQNLPVSPAEFLEGRVNGGSQSQSISLSTGSFSKANSTVLMVGIWHLIEVLVSSEAGTRSQPLQVHV